MSISPNLLESAAKQLREAHKVVVFTGAGVSAESGLPTFRSGANAMWKESDVARYATPTGFRAHAKQAWAWYAHRARAAASVAPNPAHFAIAEIERRVPVFQLITQNVDGLHQRAGSVSVLELHGTLHDVRCFDCHARSEWPKDDSQPSCALCGGMLRPNVVFFEEDLPAGAMERARAAAEECDVLLAVGTSNLVWPAREVPAYAHASGAHVYIVNPDMGGQPLRRYRMEHLVGQAGEVLPLLTSLAWPDL
jgi:NAD-dependent deacetylase